MTTQSGAKTAEASAKFTPLWPVRATGTADIIKSYVELFGTLLYSHTSYLFASLRVQCPVVPSVVWHLTITNEGKLYVLDYSDFMLGLDFSR